MGVKVEIDWSHVRAAPASGPLTLAALAADATVGAFRIFPGLAPALLRNVLQPPLRGLVLETFGVGNAPDRDRAFLDAIREAAGRGVVIVNCTQCLRGSVHQGEYAGGAALARAGVVSGYDMTAEAALCKLFYLFSIGCAADEVKARSVEDLCGELTLEKRATDWVESA